MKIKISESAYKYLGYTVIDDDKAGLRRVKDSEGNYLDAEFSTDVEAEEYIDSMTEAVAVKAKDTVRTDLSKVKGSMTNTLTAHADEIASTTSIKELVIDIKDWFKQDGIDTKASNRLIANIMKQRSLADAWHTVYNSILAGSKNKTIEKVEHRHFIESIYPDNIEYGKLLDNLEWMDEDSELNRPDDIAKIVSSALNCEESSIIEVAFSSEDEIIDDEDDFNEKLGEIISVISPLEYDENILTGSIDADLDVCEIDGIRFVRAYYYSDIVCYMYFNNTSDAKKLVNILSRIDESKSINEDTESEDYEDVLDKLYNRLQKTISEVEDLIKESSKLDLNESSIDLEDALMILNGVSRDWDDID